METIVPILMVVGILSIIILVIRVNLCAARGVRLRVKTKKPFVIPENTCVIDGGATFELHPVFKVLYVGSILKIDEVFLPFSEKGHAAYKNTMPSSLSLYKGGFYALSGIPLLGIMLALFWVTLALLIATPLAVFDVASRKRQLLKLHEVFWGVFSEELRGIDISGVSEEFAAEALRVNTGQTLSHYLKKQRKAGIWYTYTSKPGHGIPEDSSEG